MLHASEVARTQNHHTPPQMATKTTGIQNWHIVVGENKFMNAGTTFSAPEFVFFFVVIFCRTCGQIAGECTHSSYAYLAALTCGNWEFVWLWLLLTLKFYIPQRTFWFYMFVQKLTMRFSFVCMKMRIQFFATLHTNIFNILQSFKLQKTGAYTFWRGEQNVNMLLYSILCTLQSYEFNIGINLD